MCRKRWSTLGIIFTLTSFILAGCNVPLGGYSHTQTNQLFQPYRGKDVKELNGKHIDLSHVILIIPLYEFADSTSIPEDRSQIVFIHDDGTYEIQDNHYMFSKTVAWTDRGVFYSDWKYDYFIDMKTEIMHVTPHEKTEFEYTTYEIDDSHVATMYNKGIGLKDNGLLSVSSADDPHTYEELTYTVGDEFTLGSNVGACANGNTYEIGVAGVGSAEPTNVMYQLSEKDKPVYKKVHSIKATNVNYFDDFSEIHQYTGNQTTVAFGSGFGYPSTVCSDNWIYGLVDIGKSLDGYGEENPKGYIKALMKWNVISGENSFLPLRDEHNKIMYSPYGDKWNTIQYTNNSLESNQFIMSSMDTGAIAAVDMETGIVTQIAPPLVSSDKWPIGNVKINCSRAYIYQTWIPMNDDLGKHSYINVYSRETYKLINTIKIDDSFTQYEQNNSVQSGFPVFNPDYLKKQEVVQKRN
ncbi:hypothetical protein EJ419_00640 [Alloscardovia theropitheci]|uniref:Uncharacterized protein n=1 Tax=Alloscardovia theropitheci TaxID=2496842 RepID=A0A4R0QU81_9BIFI|nr:hypothetical protein [Alloscardovia theropitheci]TCD54935.1 hypothetical protein EJ419_00640 [Alloscardovia theropitheci]